MCVTRGILACAMHPGARHKQAGVHQRAASVLSEACLGAQRQCHLCELLCAEALCTQQQITHRLLHLQAALLPCDL